RACVRLSGGALTISWRAGLFPRPVDPDAALLRNLLQGNASTRRAFRGGILRFVSAALIAGNVLSLHWLPYLGLDQEPDHRRDHFFLRNYPLILSRFGSVHSSRC